MEQPGKLHDLTVDDLPQKLGQVLEGLKHHERYALMRGKKVVGYIVPAPLAVDDLDAGYLAMAADEEHEAEALEWSEGVVADVADEPG